MDSLNSVANNLDPCQNVKMQKHKDYHFGTCQVQFGTVRFKLRGGTWKMRKEVSCEPCLPSLCLELQQLSHTGAIVDPPLTLRGEHERRKISLLPLPVVFSEGLRVHRERFVPIQWAAFRKHRGPVTLFPCLHR